jgi:AraC-like DNA-binding protein
LNEAKKNNNQRGEALAAIGIGHIFLGRKEYPEAEKFLVKSLAVSRQIGDRKMLAGIYMGLMQLKNETGKFEEAHQYMAAYYQMKDSLLNAERAGQIAELEIRYETQEKEHAIQLLERDKKIQNLWKNILIASIILLAIASIVVYYLQRYKERKNRQILNLEIEQLTTQHSELSEKYKNVLTGGAEKSVDSHDQRLLKKAIEVVETNMSNPLFSVEKMAKEVGMSRTNMHRKIKAITGFPPSELIRSIRLRKAAILLLSKADSVSQISFTVGFDDHSYFSKSFKKQFGVSPSEYLQSRGQRMSDQPRA